MSSPMHVQRSLKGSFMFSGGRAWPPAEYRERGRVWFDVDAGSGFMHLGVRLPCALDPPGGSKWHYETLKTAKDYADFGKPADMVRGLINEDEATCMRVAELALENVRLMNVHVGSLTSDVHHVRPAKGEGQ